MAKELLKIRILNGALQGQELDVQKGLTLSRSQGEQCFFIKDSAASNPHAEVVQKKQTFYLQDKDSKNGTYVEGQINDFFPLRPDLKFRIGKTYFQVVLQAPPPPPPVVEKKPDPHWSVLVQQQLKDVEPFVFDQEQPLQPFDPLLCLHFQSGVQKSDFWALGYGPRQAGRACVDLPIWDSLAPDVCFSLHPQAKGKVLLKTPCPDKVLLNTQHNAKKILKNGDFISFGSTSIKVSFRKK